MIQQGLREDIPQDWYVKTVIYSLSKQGYRTSAQLMLKELNE